MGLRRGDRRVLSAAGKTDRPAIARGDLKGARRGHMQVGQAPVTPWRASADIDPFGSARCQQDLRWLSRLQRGHCGGLSSARAIDETNDMAMCHLRSHLAGASDLGRLPMARKYRTRSAPHPIGPPRMIPPEAIVVPNLSEKHRGIAGDHEGHMAAPSGRPGASPAASLGCLEAYSERAWAWQAGRARRRLVSTAALLGAGVRHGSVEP